MSSQSFDQQAVDAAVMRLLLSVLNYHGLDPGDFADEELRMLIRFVSEYFPYHMFVNFDMNDWKHIVTGVENLDVYTIQIIKKKYYQC